MEKSGQKLKELKSVLWMMIVYVSLLMIMSIFLVGCLEHTMHGFGRAVQGTGSLVTGMGQDIQQAADNYGK